MANPLTIRPRSASPATAFPAIGARLRAWAHAQLASNPVVSELQGLALLAKARLPLARGARLSALLTAGRRLRLSPARRWLKRELAPFVAGPAVNVCREE